MSIDRRQQIIEATVTLIRRDGIEGTSMRAIAREIDFTTGVLTHHFRNKEDLLSAVVEEMFLPYMQDLETAYLHDDIYKGLISIFTNAIPEKDKKDKLPYLYAYLILQLDKYPKVGHIYREQYGILRNGVCSLLQKGQRTGHLHSDFDAKQKTDILFALVDGVGLHAIAEPERFRSQRLKELVIGEISVLKNAEKWRVRRTVG